MAYLGNFNAAEVQPMTEMVALPNGEYLMAITASEMKPTKDGNGEYLFLTFTVVDAKLEEHKHRKVFVRLNLVNNNSVAVDIAKRELSAICHAIGRLNIADSQDLHDRPMTCKVQHIPPKGEYLESNKITAYKPASEYGKGPNAPRPAGPAGATPIISRPVAASAPTTNPAPFAPRPAAAQAPVAAPIIQAPAAPTTPPWRQAKAA